MISKFPDEFLWGASTSSHQVEGDNFYNDWWEWEKNGGTSPSGKACDHYNRFREDFLLARELGHNAHRLGIEWSRLEKEEGTWDDTEWNHYKLVIDELIKLKIKPIVTLNHFTLPLWLSHDAGWLNERIVFYFARFAEKAVKELGDRVEYWITINEPNILAFLSYYFGQWPPCHKNFCEALLAFRNMLKAHVEAYIKMHSFANTVPKIKKPRVGIANAVTAFHPCSPYSILDRLSAYARVKLHNHSFIVSAIRGRILIPNLGLGRLPCKNAMDFIGLNYYFRQFIHHQKSFFKNRFGEVCALLHHADSGKTTDMGWEIYPKGIYEVAKSFSRYKLPIIITENGIATTDDDLRKNYIRDHLAQLLNALTEGAPIIGYLHWSLLDNFEWADGYSKRFGLVSVDYTSQKRTVTDSARYFRSIIQNKYRF